MFRRQRCVNITIKSAQNNNTKMRIIFRFMDGRSQSVKKLQLVATKITAVKYCADEIMRMMMIMTTVMIMIIISFRSVTIMNEIKK